jgi:hypothetical protein
MFSFMGSSSRVLELLAELDLYRRRYRAVEVPEQIESMNLGISKRARRVEAIRRQVTEMLDEMARLEDEIGGLQSGYEALLLDALDRIRREHDEGWSPTPVIGYRLWEWRDGGLYGAWEQWRSAMKKASCRHPGDIPHSNGQCGRLGCGVYATKALDPLLSPRLSPGSLGCAAGVVEMTGKVVEHEHGYRGARARAVQLVLIGDEGLAHLDDPPALAAAFRDPDHAYATTPHARPQQDLAAHIQSIFEGSIPWTSETKSA